ncbi:MAG: thiamine phosphate synthase [Deltaproteobacteria bacterium]|nr:thiamine phosphate synthase [Deltaproteobacteria bacterium]
MKLYVVTDRRWLRGRDLCDAVEEILDNGATLIQLREKNVPRHRYAADAVKIRKLCRSRGVPFVINDDIAAAAEFEADGVHVGQEDGSVAEARRLLGKDKIVGVSVDNVEQALLAEHQGADYLGVGAMFPTGSKADADRVALTTLAEICRRSSLPVVAIGGIGKENIGLLRETGVDGVAVISAIFAQEDLGRATRELRALLD